jgi:hypothetical protein
MSSWNNASVLPKMAQDARSYAYNTPANDVRRGTQEALRRFQGASKDAQGRV